MHFHSDMAWQWEITLERWLRLHCIDTAGNQTNLWRDAPSQPDDITLLPFLLAQEVINECWLYNHEALSHKKTWETVQPLWVPRILGFVSTNRKRDIFR